MLILKATRAEYPGLNWLSKSLSLSGGLRLIANVIDLFPSCNYWVQMEIWFRDKDSILSLASNCRNRLEFELNEVSRSEVPKAATFRMLDWCWISTWRDLREVENWPLYFPLT